MFDLSSIVWLAGISIVVTLFWQFRRLGERAQAYAQHYCKQHQLQYLDIARQQGSFKLTRQGPIWQTTFCFGFSSDKESRYEGHLVFANARLIKVQMPVYRVPDPIDTASVHAPQPTAQSNRQSPTASDYRPNDWYQR